MASLLLILLNMSHPQSSNNSHGQNPGGGGGGSNNPGNSGPDDPNSSKPKKKPKPAHVAVDVEPPAPSKKVKSKTNPTQTDPQPSSASQTHPPEPEKSSKRSKKDKKKESEESGGRHHYHHHRNAGHHDRTKAEGEESPEEERPKKEGKRKKRRKNEQEQETERSTVASEPQPWNSSVRPGPPTPVQTSSTFTDPERGRSGRDREENRGYPETSTSSKAPDRGQGGRGENKGYPDTSTSSKAPDRGQGGRGENKGYPDTSTSSKGPDRGQGRRGENKVYPETMSKTQVPEAKKGSLRNPNELHRVKSVTILDTVNLPGDREGKGSQDRSKETSTPTPQKGALPSQKAARASQKETPAPKKRHHHHEFIKSLLRDATAPEQSEHRHKHRRGNIAADVYRVRDGPNTYKFRKFSSVGKPEDPMEDPLLFSNIKKAATFEEWKREAHLALPSNIGVPVENSGDVMNLGNSVKQQRAAGSFDHKTAYNSLYNDMENRFSYDDKRYKARARKSYTDLTAGPSKRNSRMSVVEPSVNRKPITFLRKLKAIRELTDHMEEKRYHKAELVKYGKLEGELLENKRTWKDNVAIYLAKLHDRLRDTFRRLYLWQHDLRMIHGRYGIGIAIYFHWLRTVVSMNIIQTILAFAFVVFPEIYARYNVPSAILSSCPTNILSVETCALLPSAKDEDKFSAADPFTGRGYLQQSLFFYSGYRDTLADPFCPAHEVFQSGLFAQTAMRFIIVVLILFAINSIYLMLKVKQYYQTAELESKIPGLHKKQRFRSFFSSWDFSVIDPTTATTLHKNIWRGFMDACVETDHAFVKKAVPAERPYLERKLEEMCDYNKAVIIVHVLMTVLLLIIYTLAGYIMWLSLAWRMIYKEKLIDSNSCNEFSLIPNYILVFPTFVMSGLYLGVGFFSAFIAQFESWESNVAKNFAFIVRVGIYYFMTVAIIYSFFMHQASKSESMKGLLCYEDFFGNEIYRLIVLQGFVYITTTFIAYNIYVCMNRRNSAWTKPQFDPVNYTMRALYLHTISGIGFFYCPLVSLLVLIRQVITFYHHKRMLLHFYRLSGHIIQTSDVYLPFMLAYLFSYLTTTAMNIAFFEFHPSSVCGPFSHYTEHHQIRTGTTESGHYYEVFVQGFKASGNNAVINFFLSPGTAFVIILFLLTLMWCLHCWGVGHLNTIQELYHFLQLERKDRDFLLEAIYHFAKRASKEMEMTEKIEGKDGEGEDGETSFDEESIFEGVFKHRRGSLATHKPPKKVSIKPDPRMIAVEGDEEPHGTIGRQIKEDFKWLPSRWHRRDRRAAEEMDLEIPKETKKKFLKIYRKALKKDKAKDVEASKGVEQEDKATVADKPEKTKSKVKKDKAEKKAKDVSKGEEQEDKAAAVIEKPEKTKSKSKKDKAKKKAKDVEASKGEEQEDKAAPAVIEKPEKTKSKKAKAKKAMDVEIAATTDVDTSKEEEAAAAIIEKPEKSKGKKGSKKDKKDKKDKSSDKDKGHKNKRNKVV